MSSPFAFGQRPSKLVRRAVLNGDTLPQFGTEVRWKDGAGRTFRPPLTIRDLHRKKATLACNGRPYTRLMLVPGRGPRGDSVTMPL
jgi:hypothetical protein